MDKHIKALGLLHVIYGVLGVGSAYSLATLLGLHQMPFVQTDWFLGVLPQVHIMYNHSNDVLHVLGIGLFGAITLVSLAQIVGGCGLLGHKSWSRILILVLGILILPRFPFGTALGIYTLWVVFRPGMKEMMVS